MRNKLLTQLVARSRGVSAAEAYASFRLENPRVLADTAIELMENIPPSFGACAMMSASWAGFLQDHYSISAIVVAGDLKIEGSKVFKCKKNLPDSRRQVTANWDGHCWIEIDGFIGDISVFRTAYSINGPSKLREFVVSTFGQGRGSMVCPFEELPPGMQYIPKFVLKNNQINGLIAGMGHQIENSV